MMHLMIHLGDDIVSDGRGLGFPVFICIFRPQIKVLNSMCLN